jgi:hypothetical protein
LMNGAFRPSCKVWLVTYQGAPKMKFIFSACGYPSCDAV